MKGRIDMSDTEFKVTFDEPLTFSGPVEPPDKVTVSGTVAVELTREEYEQLMARWAGALGHGEVIGGPLDGQRVRYAP